MSAIRSRPGSGDLHQPFEEDQQPARRARDGRNLGLQRAFGEAPDLGLPVGDAFQVARREVAQPRPGGHFLRRDAAQIAAPDPRRAARQPGRAAEHEDAPGEQPAVRPVGEMVDQQIGARAHVRPAHLPAHGDVFRGAGRRSRRHGEPGNRAGPRAVGEPGKGRAPVGFPERVVIPERNPRPVVVERPDGGEAVVPPEPGAARAADQGRQHAALNRKRVHPRQMPEPPSGVEPQKPGRVVHRPAARQFPSESACGKLSRTAESVSGTRTYSPRRHKSH